MDDRRIIKARQLLYEAATLIEAVKAGTDGDRFTEIAAMCTELRTIRDRLGEIDKETQ